MTDPTPLEREYPHFEEIHNLVTGKDERAMTDPTPLEQPRNTTVALSQDEIATLLAATTLEPARLSAEATALAEQLDLYADRACDADHPDGWLESWTEECVETVRRAAILLRALRSTA